MTCARLLLLLLLLRLLLLRLRLCLGLGLLWLGLLWCVVALDNPSISMYCFSSRGLLRERLSLVLAPCSALTSGIPLNST